MVSSNRLRLSRAEIIPTVPLLSSQEAPLTDVTVEIVADTMDASTTGDSNSANPSPLLDPSFAATDAAAHLSFASNP